MNIDRFRASLTDDSPPPGLTDPARALWHAGRDEWDRAHDIAQDDPTPAGAWVHAYLHRVEGDLWNADYWYRRAGRERPRGTTEEEWGALAGVLLGEGGAVKRAAVNRAS